LLNITGASIGRSCVVPESLSEANVNQHVCIIRCTNDLSPSFLSHFLNSTLGQKQIWSFQGGGSREGLNYQQIASFEVPLFSRDQQDAIAKTADQWGAAIVSAERLIDCKEEHVKWLFKELLPVNLYKNVSVSSFTTECSQRNLGAKCERVLSVTNQNGFVLPEDRFERRVASADLSNYKVVSRGQYAYNPSRINVGSIARLDHWDQGVLSPMYVVFLLDEKKVDSDFFQHWLSSHEAKQRIRKSAQGSVRESVSFTDLGAIQFPLPLLDKQRKIAEILNAAKTEIDLLKKLAEGYRKQKRGLMQKLLTGQWRIKS
jgi:type I restriction enzyme S subunit